eukprot:scaffold32878_cov73-Isochrysis_galbana.AAC.1
MKQKRCRRRSRRGVKEGVGARFPGPAATTDRQHRQAALVLRRRARRDDARSTAARPGRHHPPCHVAPPDRLSHAPTRDAPPPAASLGRDAPVERTR